MTNVDWWETVKQGGPIAVLLGLALVLVFRGVVVPSREVVAKDQGIAQLRADFEKRLVEKDAEHAQDMSVERARYEEMRTSYEARIIKLEALAERNAAMVLDLSGAARALADASKRRADVP